MFQHLLIARPTNHDHETDPNVNNESATTWSVLPIQNALNASIKDSDWQRLIQNSNAYRILEAGVGTWSWQYREEHVSAANEIVSQTVPNQTVQIFVDKACTLKPWLWYNSTNTNVIERTEINVWNTRDCQHLNLSQTFSHKWITEGNAKQWMCVCSPWQYQLNEAHARPMNQFGGNRIISKGSFGDWQRYTKGYNISFLTNGNITCGGINYADPPAARPYNNSLSSPGGTSDVTINDWSQKTSKTKVIWPRSEGELGPGLGFYITEGAFKSLQQTSTRLTNRHTNTNKKTTTAYTHETITQRRKL